MTANDVESYTEQLLVLGRGEQCVDFNALLQRLFNEPQREIVDGVLSNLRKVDDSLVTCLCNFIAHNGGYVEKFPVLEEILFEKILLAPEQIGPLLIAAQHPDEISCYVHCANALAIEAAAPALEEKLATVADEKLIIDILEALTRIGYCDKPENIADYLYSANRRIIGPAILCLGGIGSHEALQVLSKRMGTDSEFDRLILDQFARIQDQFCIEQLNDTLASHITHVRNYGKEKLTAIGAKAIPVIIENLLSDDPDFVVHSLNVLGTIKDESAIKPIRNLLHSHPQDANIRFAAYESLGELPCQKVAYALAEGLNDSDGSVRTAAARAINNNYSKILGGGVKNLLRSSAFDHDEIVSAIVDSESEHIFLDVVAEDDLREQFFAYLRERAHSDVIKFFSKALKNNGREDWVKQITAADASATPQKMMVYAIDDSRMVLNIYRSALHKLGYEFKLFEFPETALQSIAVDAPKFVFTDLNMPLISGIDVAAKLRETYSAKELPIVMVTTQSESDSRQAALAAGVNEVISKPFTAATLQQAIEKHI